MQRKAVIHINLFPRFNNKLGVLPKNCTGTLKHIHLVGVSADARQAKA